MKYYLIAITILYLTGCGYKPSAHGAQKMIGNRVFTQVDVSLSDPENAVLTKDALNIALQTRLKRIVSKQSSADSSIFVRYKKIRFIPLQYNRNGYVVFYQAQITLEFMFIKGEMKEQRDILGHFEFPIRPSAIISNDLRLKAIEQGSLKALDQFIAYLSVKGFLLNEK
jgi:hypothetical protein